MVREDGQNRIKGTTAQTGAAAAIVTVGSWLAHQAGWHGDLPIDVAGAMVVLLSAGAAWFSNRSRLKA